MVKINTKGFTNVNSIKVAESFNNKMMSTTSIDYVGTDMYGEQCWRKGYSVGYWGGITVAATCIGVFHLVNKISDHNDAKRREKIKKTK